MMPPPEPMHAPPASPLVAPLIPAVLTLLGPATTPTSVPRNRPPASARMRTSRERNGPYRCTAMSRLFSSASAITSCAERYRLPARTSCSSRGVLTSFTGATTRFSRWNGFRNLPQYLAGLGWWMDTSEVWQRRPCRWPAGARSKFPRSEAGGRRSNSRCMV